MIRNNVQLKYAMKRKVSDPAQWHLQPQQVESLLPRINTCMYLQSCEEEEAFKLLHLSKEEETEAQGDQEDEELVIAEYESDDESKTRSR